MNRGAWRGVLWSMGLQEADWTEQLTLLLSSPEERNWRKECS